MRVGLASHWKAPVEQRLAILKQEGIPPADILAWDLNCSPSCIFSLLVYLADESPKPPQLHEPLPLNKCFPLCIPCWFCFSGEPWHRDTMSFKVKYWKREREMLMFYMWFWEMKYILPLTVNKHVTVILNASPPNESFWVPRAPRKENNIHYLAPIRLQPLPTVSTENSGVKTQDTGPRQWRCTWKEWLQWAQALASSHTQKSAKFFNLGYLVFSNSQKYFWCSDYLSFVTKLLYNLDFSPCFFRAVLSGLSLSSFLGRCYLPALKS